MSLSIENLLIQFLHTTFQQMDLTDHLQILPLSEALLQM